MGRLYRDAQGVPQQQQKKNDTTDKDFSLFSIWRFKNSTKFEYV